MKKIVLKILIKIYQIVFTVLNYTLPKKKNSIVFESFLGKQYSDNPRAIYEYLLENKYDFEMYWSIDKRHINEIETSNIHYIKRFSVKWLFIMARAKYWVTNSRLPLWLPKSNKTIYVQTWHGTPLKRLAKDMDQIYMPDTDLKKYQRDFVNEAKKWDYLISPNSYSTQIFKRAFEYKNKLIEAGYPRNDFLINNNSKEITNKIKVESNLPRGKKIILYAPTWRDNQYHDKGKYTFNIEMNLERMREELSDEYIILLRMHYFIAERINISRFQGFVYDFSNYMDIRELYLISDILITDYSSVFFDYAILNRPIIFYVYDLDEYRNKLRGFYYDFEKKAPGPLVKTTDEIIEAINNIKKHPLLFKNKVVQFSKEFNSLEDGCSTKRYVEAIFLKDNKH